MSRLESQAKLSRGLRWEQMRVMRVGLRVSRTKENKHESAQKSNLVKSRPSLGADMCDDESGLESVERRGE
jgi:hypothetical protein